MLQHKDPTSEFMGILSVAAAASGERLAIVEQMGNAIHRPVAINVHSMAAKTNMVADLLVYSKGQILQSNET